METYLENDTLGIRLLSYTIKDYNTQISIIYIWYNLLFTAENAFVRNCLELFGVVCQKIAGKTGKYRWNSGF